MQDIEARKCIEPLFLAAQSLDETSLVGKLGSLTAEIDDMLHASATEAPIAFW
jgi:hypothetical protein